MSRLPPPLWSHASSLSPNQQPSQQTQRRVRPVFPPLPRESPPQTPPPPPLPPPSPAMVGWQRAPRLFARFGPAAFWRGAPPNMSRPRCSVASDFNVFRQLGVLRPDAPSPSQSAKNRASPVSIILDDDSSPSPPVEVHQVADDEVEVVTVVGDTDDSVEVEILGEVTRAEKQQQQQGVGVEKRAGRDVEVEVIDQIISGTFVSERKKARLQQARQATPPLDVTPPPRTINRLDATSLRRLWEGASPSKRTVVSDKANMAFKICSYNVLCQETIAETRYLYRHCLPGDLDWQNRKRLIAEEFQRLDADIYCLQEVQQEHFHSFYDAHFRPQGYHGVFKKRTGIKPDGCAVFVRDAKFEIVSASQLDFFVPNTFALDRDNVGQVLSLRPAGGAPDARLVVANTHLLFNKKRGDVKFCQLALLLAEIDRMACLPNADGHHPIVLCGDLNLEPLSPMYEFIVRGGVWYYELLRGTASGQSKRSGGPPLGARLLPPEARVTDTCQHVDEWRRRQQLAGLPEGQPPMGTGHLSHQLKLMSVYQHRNASGGMEVSTAHSVDTANVDYIFYALARKRVEQRDGTLVCGGVREGPLKLLQRYSLPDAAQINATTGLLPNAAAGSDHLPLAAKFALDL